MNVNDYETKSETELHEAHPRGVYLHGVYKHWADLRREDLSGEDLSRADLSGADLRGADLSGADMRGVLGILMISPLGSRGMMLVVTKPCNVIHVELGIYYGDLPGFVKFVNIQRDDYPDKDLLLCVVPVIEMWGKTHD